MKEKFLIFKDTVTGEVWEHNANDWILTFCNFDNEIHPTLLRVGHSMTVTDKDKHKITITAVNRIAEESHA